MAPLTVAHQAPLSMGFPRQEYCSGLLFPSPGDPPDPGIKPWSPALKADSLLTEHRGAGWPGIYLHFNPAVQSQRGNQWKLRVLKLLEHFLLVLSTSPILPTYIILIAGP